MTVETADPIALEFEKKLADTVRSFAHDNAPLIRKALEAESNENLTTLTYFAFLGHSVASVARVVGLDATRELFESAIAELETIETAGEEAPS